MVGAKGGLNRQNDKTKRGGFTVEEAPGGDFADSGAGAACGYEGRLG